MNAVKRGLLGKYVRPALFLADWVLINTMFAVTLCYFGQHIPADTPRWLMWTLLNLAVIPVGVYDSHRDTTSLRAIQLDKSVRGSLVVVGIHAVFFLALIGLVGYPQPDWKFYVAYYGSLLAIVTAWNIISRRLIKAYRKRGYNYMRVAIVGTNTGAHRLYDAMNGDAGFGYKVIGFFGDEPAKGLEKLYSGTIDKLDEYVKENAIDQIYFTLPGTGEEIARVMKVADDNVVEFFYVPQISKFIARNFQVSNIGVVPLLTIGQNPLKGTVNKTLKRGFDIAVSSLFLLFYPLIYIPVAIAIKMGSKGPVYFKQERTGYKGKPFMCLKFRTMKVNSEANTAQATENDPRKTRLGDLLRRTSIDELPQFINVWKGDMSIVGPRPHMLRHTEEYSQLVDRYMARHFVKPGITGWAQVNGYRGPTDELWKMEKRVEFDMWYIEHWNFFLDLKIIARTVYNALAGEENAY